jgi:hypothetical protein
MSVAGIMQRRNVRFPTRAEPGKRARYDYEYVPNRTANVFMFIDINHPWRKAKVTGPTNESRLRRCMRDLVDLHYPEAQCIRVVLDSRSTHSSGARYERLPPAEARRILDRLEFQYTPKHASCLNMVEIEIGVKVGQCLARRIPDKARLMSELASRERRRNAERARINGMFTIDRARMKLRRAARSLPTCRPRPPPEPVAFTVAGY